MALPPDVEAELDAAYQVLLAAVETMLEAGHHPRAVIGAMGRLYIELMNEELSADERRDMAGHLARAMGVAAH